MTLESAPDGTVWLVAGYGHDDIYHVFNCLPLQGARAAGVTIDEVDIAGPEILGGRLMCHACARRMRHDTWDPATGAPAVS